VAAYISATQLSSSRPAHTFQLRPTFNNPNSETQPASNLPVYRYIPFHKQLDFSKFFNSPTDAQVNCLKNNFKIYIKISIKTAATCFGTVTPSSGSALLVLAKVTVVKIASLLPKSARYTHQQGPTNICSHFTTQRFILIGYFNNCNFSKHQ